MNFHNLNKKLVWLFSLVVLTLAVTSCGSKSNTGGKTLSSAKSTKSTKSKGLKGLFFKPASADPGVFNGEIVAVNRKGWSQPTPFGMVLVPSGSYLMGQGDEDPSRSAINFPRRVTVSAFFMDDTEINVTKMEEQLKIKQTELNLTQIISKWADPGKTTTPYIATFLFIRDKVKPKPPT